jgi:hypothetical protein
VALAIDKATGATHWKDAVSFEINNDNTSFQELEENESVPVGYQFVMCHLIFDIKVRRLKRKVHYVTGEHMTYPQAEVTYASAVSRESV